MARRKVLKGTLRSRLAVAAALAVSGLLTVGCGAVGRKSEGSRRNDTGTGTGMGMGMEMEMGRQMSGAFERRAHIAPSAQPTEGPS